MKNEFDKALKEEKNNHAKTPSLKEGKAGSIPAEGEMPSSSIGNNEIKKENYIFGDFFGNLMRKTSPRFQLESSMMSYLLILISLIIFLGHKIYTWSDGAWYWNLLYSFNFLAGILIIYAQIAGSFQAYQQVCEAEEVTKIMKEVAGDVNNMLNDNTQNEIDEMKGGIEEIGKR